MKKFIFKATILGVFTVAFSLFLIKDIKAEDKSREELNRMEIDTDWGFIYNVMFR